MIEVTYPYYQGGEMLDAYQADDQAMAQASINAAIDSARFLERERIIKLLEEDADNNYYALQLIKGEQK